MSSFLGSEGLQPRHLHAAARPTSQRASGHTLASNSAPAGWEKTVEKMKHEPRIDNPFALAYYMKAHGAHPSK